MNSIEETVQQRPVEILIPVYGNAGVTRSCIESVLASELPADTGITVINDCSPDDEVRQYCEQLADSDRVKVLVNEANRGFVATANRGFSSVPESDVLLLNSDTLVSGNWLQRLRDCAYLDEQIGTVTPFSNNATICSYPVFTADNALPDGWTADMLDRLFQQANRGEHTDIPTAVGFCMYIRRDCLEAIGRFDEEHFGQGYGEECDFSMRAAAAGWRNLLAADVFIYHHGSASFGEESDQRKEQAGQVLSQLHPEYDEQVSEFILDDSLAGYRLAVDDKRLQEKPEEIEALLSEAREARNTVNKTARAHYRSARSEHQYRLKQERELATALEKVNWLDQQHKEQFQQAQWHEKKAQELAEARHYLEQQNTKLVEANTALTERSAQLDHEAQSLREIYQRTDAALGDAQRIAAETRSELEASARLAENLSAELQQIKESRSWRYTAWLRRRKR